MNAERPQAAPGGDRRRLLVATGNPGKLAELQALAEDLPVEMLAPDALPGGLPAVEEDGETFLDNAVKKARAAAAAAAGRGVDAWALADDSGLCVDALDGAPGVRSARWSGVTGEDRDRANLDKLLEELRGVAEEERGAAFWCVIAVARADALLFAVEGSVHGRILEHPDGDGGFGYDPVFYHEPSAASFARLPPERKAAVGHRGAAMARLRNALETVLALPGA